MSADYIPHIVYTLQPGDTTWCVMVMITLFLIRFRDDEMCQPDYVQNPELNVPLYFDELEYMINKLKKNKSVGIDQIPNEVLKKHDVMLILFQLYVKFFDSGLVPSLWLKAIITPIPKKFYRRSICAIKLPRYLFIIIPL